MKKYFVFTYGTLSNQSVLKKLCNQNIKLHKARLNNYIKIADQSPWLLIKKKKNTSIDGYVFKVTKNQLIHLDWWESVPLYERKQKKIILLSNNKKINAYVYNKEPQGKTKEIDQLKLSNLDENSILNQIPLYKNNLFDLIFVTKTSSVPKISTMSCDENVFLNFVNSKINCKFDWCQKWEFNNFIFYILFKKISNGKYIIYGTSLHNFSSKKNVNEFIKNFKNETYICQGKQYKINISNVTFLIHSNTKWKNCLDYSLLHDKKFNKEWKQRVTKQIKWIQKNNIINN